MSDSIRQSNIFGEGFEWDIIYSAFKEADFQSYDYNDIYQSMTKYIRKHHGDEFNNFIKSTEMFAHVNLLAFLGQNLSVRMDVSTQDNYLSSAQRRDNILNMAYMVSYQPKRNIPAHGLLKITGIKTTEDVKDSNQETLSSSTLVWDQDGVFDWYDRFIRIIRNVVSPENKFGFPHQELEENGLKQHIYRLNQYNSYNTIYSFRKVIEGEELNFNIVPSTLENGEIIEEAPSSKTPFNIIYQSDGKGNKSPDTGFFVQFKEGRMFSQNNTYTFPKYHRREMVDVPDINNSDVWVQEVDASGNTLHHWTKVSSETGQNIIYNTIDPDDRKIFFVKTRKNDTVEILYSDTYFGNAPVGTMRTWFRVSANVPYALSEEYFKDIPIEIPYIGRDSRQHTLTLYVTNLVEYNNVVTRPSNDEIKYLAPESRYTQDRMVNTNDYNIYSKERLPFAKKMRIKNRDNSTKSRYPHLDVHDPTGAHSNIEVNADDGYLFDDYYELTSRFYYDIAKIDKDNFVQRFIEPLIKQQPFMNYFINYLFFQHHIDDVTRFNLQYSNLNLRWKNHDKTKLSNRGTFYYTDVDKDNNTIAKNVSVGVEHGNEYNKLHYIRDGSKIRMIDTNQNEYWITIIEVRDVRGYSELVTDTPIPDNCRPDIVLPGMSTQLESRIKDKIVTMLNRQQSFGLRYDFELDTYLMISEEQISSSDETFGIVAPTHPSQSDDRWMVKCIFTRDIVSEYYDIVVRGQRFIFGSERQVRFFFNTFDKVIDSRTGLSNQDNVSVLASNGFNNADINADKLLFVARKLMNIERF